MTVKKTQQNLSTTLEKTEQTLGSLENSLGNDVEASLLATAENSEANDGLPEEWCEIKISEVAEVVAGGTPKAGDPSNFADPGSSIAWLTPADLSKYKSSYISHGKRDLSQSGYDSSSAKLLPKGSLLFSSRAPIGYVAIASNEISTNQGFKNFVFQSGVNSLFAYYYLNSIRSLAESLGTGTTFKEISGATAKKLPFILPPLAEQTVIAQTLDTLLAQVDNIKTRLDAIPKILKTFRQSVLAAAVSGKLTEEWRGENECEITKDEILNTRFSNWCDEKIAEFSLKGKTQKNELWKDKYKLPELIESEKIWTIPGRWCWSTIDAVSKVTKLAGFEFTKHVNYTDTGDLPVIKAENVGINGYRHKSYSYVKSVEVEMLTRSELFGREILVVFVGAGVGQVGISPSDKKYFLGPNVAVVKQDSNLYLPEYLELYLKSLSGKGVLLSFSKGGAQPSLSMGQIRKTSIPIPPVEEQTEIVRRVEELFAFADQIEQQVKNAQGRVNNLTQSILAKAFRGELSAQWRAENPDLISGDNSAKALLAKIQEERDALKQKAKPKKKCTAKKTKKKVAEK